VHGFGVERLFDMRCFDPRLLRLERCASRDVNRDARRWCASRTGIRRQPHRAAIGLALRSETHRWVSTWITCFTPCRSLDDLATLHWRTHGGQKAPLIVRTRGHRLEGIWHSGSPMAATIHLLRGMYVATPRNMTQAAGIYNTLLRSDEPGVWIQLTAQAPAGQSAAGRAQCCARGRT
jgi:hypothetical protein